jgi:4-amino-4-deoxy-L-arabinose transferase-like glycosyltransferase
LTQILEWIKSPRSGVVLSGTCGLLITVGLLLALLNLGALPFWVDESIAALPALSIHDSLLPVNPFDLDFMPWQLKYDLWDPATPLYRYALALFTAVVGFSEWTARLFSVGMGGFAALALWALARRVLDSDTAWVAAALMVISPTFMVHAREARHFTFLMFLAITTLYLLYVASQDPKSRAVILWTIALTATLLTQTLGYLILPIAAAYVVLVGPRRVLDVRYWPVYSAVAALYIAIMIVFWDTLPFFHTVDCTNRTAGCQPDPGYYLGALNEFLGPMETRRVYRWWRTFSLAQPLALIGLGVVILRAVRVRASREGAALLLLWLLLPLLLLSTREVKFERYLFIWAFPVIALFVAIGIVAISRAPGLRRVRNIAATAIVVVVALAPQLRHQYQDGAGGWSPRLALPSYVRKHLLPKPKDSPERIRYQTTIIDSFVRPDDVVVSTFDDASLGYHSGRFVYGFLNSQRTDGFFMDLLSRTEASGNRVWLFDTLPHWNYCVTSEEEPKNIDCASKYPRFYAACQSSIEDPTASCIRIPIL